MEVYRLFRLLEITLYLLVCMCASGTESKPNRLKSVRELQKRANNALQRAQELFSEAECIIEMIESGQLKAEKAASEAVEAANGNKDIEAIVEKAKSAIKEFRKVYRDADQKTKMALDTTKDLLSKASQVAEKTKTKVFPAAHSPDYSSTVSKNTLSVYTEVETLEKDIEKAQLLVTSASDALSTVTKNAQNIQVAKYQIDAIVTVREIHIMLSESEDDIETTELMREDVNKTVEEAKKLLNNAPKELLQQLNGLFIFTEAALRKINIIIIEELETKEIILENKKHANDALVKIQNENNEATARQELLKIDLFASHAAAALEALKNSLKMANVHVKNANYRKNDMLKILLKYKTYSGGEKDLQSETPDQPEQYPTTQAVHTQTVQPTDNTLKEIVQYPTKNSVSKQNVSLFGASNDKSTILSVKLLLVFIAVAFIH